MWGVFFDVTYFTLLNLQTCPRSEAGEWKKLKTPLPDFSQESEQELKKL